MDIHSNDHFYLWGLAQLKIMDIRRLEAVTGEQRLGYTMPASFFLFVERGSMIIALNGKLQSTERFQIIHGGKGVCFDLVLASEDSVYYLLFYKANLPENAGAEAHRILERVQPFQVRYHVQAKQAISMLEDVRIMEQLSKRSGAAGLLRMKMMFYRFVNEVLTELSEQRTLDIQSGPIELAMTYIHEHYADAITVEMLAQKLGISAGHLSRLFKGATGTSVIDYVIQTRIGHAKSRLRNSAAGLQEIAASVGYDDVYYFGRVFKKMSGMSPLVYRKHGDQYNPSAALALSIAPDATQSYIDLYNDSHYHDRYEAKGGRISLNKQNKTSLAISGLISLMLILSACGNGSGAENGAANNNNSAATGTNGEQVEERGVKTVNTIFGDVEIPIKAERIVTNNMLNSILAVGAKPVGALQPYIDNPYITEDKTGIESIGAEWTVSLETIVTLEPDLIIIDIENKDEYEQYAKIAPTVVVPFGKFKNDHEEIRYFGQLLGREEEAESWLQDYDRRAGQAAKKVEGLFGPDETFTLMRWEDEFRVLGNRWGRGGQAIYDILGLNPPDRVKQELWGEEQQIVISSEVLDQYVGDHVFIVSSEGNVNYKDDPVWNLQDAVKNDQVYWFDSERYSYWDPMTTIAQAEEIADLLVEKHKK
ncbi:ABC transporter substrate-binding protein [Paenibacillus sp. strain BS8-2]